MAPQPPLTPDEAALAASIIHALRTTDESAMLDQEGRFLAVDGYFDMGILVREIAQALSSGKG